MRLRKVPKVTSIVVKLLVFLENSVAGINAMFCLKQADVPGASLNCIDPIKLHLVKLK